MSELATSTQNWPQGVRPCQHEVQKGFRMMTLDWTDGCSFIPINFSLLASSKKENILGGVKSYDRRSLAGKRRIMAQSKRTDVMIKLIGEAMKAGHKAKYVLFDSWFSNPHQIVKLHS